VDFYELNQVRMRNSLHNLDLVDDRLLSVVLALEVLLGECLDCEFGSVRVSLDEVDLLGLELIRLLKLTLAKEPLPIILITLNLIWKSVCTVSLASKTFHSK
jgi:hypothetical protein